MMNDDIKALVKQYQSISGHLHYLSKQLTDNDTQLTAIKSNNLTINSNLHAKNKPNYQLETLMTRHDELMQRINKFHQQQQTLKSKLYNFIDFKLEDPLSSQVFELHIIDNLALSKIADKLGYSLSWIKQKYLDCLKKNC